MEKSEYKNLSHPEETRIIGRGKFEASQIGGGPVGRVTLEPGWRWSQDVKPTAGTDLCQAAHYLYLISGRMHMRMFDGQEFELGPGDACFIPPGHDAWVIGNDSVIAIDWTGTTSYAKNSITKTIEEAA